MTQESSSTQVKLFCDSMLKLTVLVMFNNVTVTIRVSHYRNGLAYHMITPTISVSLSLKLLKCMNRNVKASISSKRENTSGELSTLCTTFTNPAQPLDVV